MPLTGDALDLHYRMLYGRGHEELLQNAQQKQLHQPLVTNPLALKVVGYDRYHRCDRPCSPL